MSNLTRKRLPSERRKVEILDAARRLLGRGGIASFSLEAVAREAGVAASLPRHYFGSHLDLFMAATTDVLEAVESALLNPDPSITLESRFNAYLDLLAQHPWGHAVWMRASELLPEAHTRVREARQRLAQATMPRPWSKLSRFEQIQAYGRVGFIEAVVSDWIARGLTHRQLVVEVMVHAIQQMPIPQQSATENAASNAGPVAERKRRRRG